MTGPAPPPEAAPPEAPGAARMTARERYLGVLRAPSAGKLLAASFIGRLPIGIHGLALVLFVEDRSGSYAEAGAVAAVFAAGAGLGQPLSSRVVDRLGRVRVLPPLAILHGALLLGLLMAVDERLALVLTLPLAGLAGVVVPPLSSVTRSLWPVVLRDQPSLVSAAFAAESVMIELVFVSGPLIVAVCVALAGPELALVVAAAGAVAGTFALLALAVVRTPMAVVTRGGGRLGALASPGLRTVLATTFPLGCCFGAMEVALPAFADAEDHAGMAGVLLAVWSLGSAGGGLAYGARDHSGPLGLRYSRLALLLPVGYLPLAAAPSVWVLLGLVFVAGVCIAPTLTAGYQIAGEVAPAGTETEAYAWPVTALVVGIAGGNVLAGALVEAADARAALLAAALVATLGGAVAVTRRATLVAPPRV